MRTDTSDEEFIRLFEQYGAAETARRVGVTERNVYARRKTIEKNLRIKLESPNINFAARPETSYPARYPIQVDSGHILIGSDAHYWPGNPSTAHRAFVKLIGDFKPKLVILNGDVLDGARISRHPPLGWEDKPTLVSELRACEERLTEIEEAYPKSQRIWTVGNHCARFESRLANQAPEFEGVPGFTLKEQFPYWTHCISTWVNDNTVIKHRFKGGIHATHNNTLWSGRSICTGHLHSLKVTPFDDYDGTRWGVDSGTLASVHGGHTHYVEDNPLNHRSGFIVLTYHKGVLLWPEIAAVVDNDTFQFRGSLIKC